MVSGPGTRSCRTRLIVSRRMSNICESWSLEDLVEMTEGDMDTLLRSYESGRVPSLEQVRQERP